MPVSVIGSSKAPKSSRFGTLPGNISVNATSVSAGQRPMANFFKEFPARRMSVRSPSSPILVPFGQEFRMGVGWNVKRGKNCRGEGLITRQVELLNPRARLGYLAQPVRGQLGTTEEGQFDNTRSSRAGRAYQRRFTEILAPLWWARSRGPKS